MWACVIGITLRIPGVRSLKSKRSVLRPHIERLRRMASISVAEVDHHDAWQMAGVGVAIVTPDRSHMETIVGKVRGYLQSQVDIELIEFALGYLEDPR
jgi:uncharacterized protein YlxP (DUF503 family)